MGPEEHGGHDGYRSRGEASSALTGFLSPGLRPARPHLSEIAIPETKDYVAKVMSNYWAYLALYDSSLTPRR